MRGIEIQCLINPLAASYPVVNPPQSGPDISPSSVLTVATYTQSFIPWKSANMPPKLSKTQTSQRKQPSTPLPKKSQGQGTSEGNEATSPSHSQQSAQGELWDPSSDSMSEDSDPGSSRPRGAHKWSHVLKKLPTKEDFKILITEVREACRAEIAVVRHDLKHLSDHIIPRQVATGDTASLGRP